MGGGAILGELPLFYAYGNSPYATTWLPVYDTSLSSLGSGETFGYYDDDYYELIPAPAAMVDVPSRREVQTPVARVRKLEGDEISTKSQKSRDALRDFSRKSDASRPSAAKAGDVRKKVDVFRPNSSSPPLNDEKIARRPEVVLSIPVTSPIPSENAARSGSMATEGTRGSPPRRVHSPADSRVVSIPVAFVDGDSSNAQESNVGKGNRPSRISEEDAALFIQTRYRGHAVRMSDPLKHLRMIASVKSRLSTFAEKASDDSFLQRARESAAARIEMTEGIMDLLLQLDAMQGAHPVVRDARRIVVKQVISLQEKVDALFSAKTTAEKVPEQLVDSEEITVDNLNISRPEIPTAIDDKHDVETPATVNRGDFEMETAASGTGGIDDSSPCEEDSGAHAEDDLHHSNFDGEGQGAKDAEKLENCKTDGDGISNVLEVDYMENRADAGNPLMEVDTNAIGNDVSDCESQPATSSLPGTNTASPNVEEASERIDVRPVSHTDELWNGAVLDNASESEQIKVSNDGCEREDMVTSQPPSSDIALRCNATDKIVDGEANITRLGVESCSPSGNPSEIVQAAEQRDGQNPRFDSSPQCPAISCDDLQLHDVVDALGSNLEKKNACPRSDSSVPGDGKIGKLLHDLTQENQVLKSLLISVMKWSQLQGTTLDELTCRLGTLERQMRSRQMRQKSKHARLRSRGSP